MRKICGILLLLVCLCISSVVSATGTCTVTEYNATLTKLRVHNATTDQWYDFNIASTPVTLNSYTKFTRSITADGLTEGVYDKIEYTFANSYKLNLNCKCKLNKALTHNNSQLA